MRGFPFLDAQHDRVLRLRVTLFLLSFWRQTRWWAMVQRSVRPAALAAALVLAGVASHAWVAERMLTQAQRLGPMAAGVPSAKLRLVYVRAQIGAVTQAHMVLAYYRDPMAEPLILDNLLGDIRPASRRPDLTPVFSFNAEGMWQGVGASSAGDPSARLSRWRDMLTKAKAEGWW